MVFHHWSSLRKSPTNVQSIEALFLSLEQLGVSSTLLRGFLASSGSAEKLIQWVEQRIVEREIRDIHSGLKEALLNCFRWTAEHVPVELATPRVTAWLPAINSLINLLEDTTKALRDFDGTRPREVTKGFIRKGAFGQSDPRLAQSTVFRLVCDVVKEFPESMIEGLEIWNLPAKFMGKFEITFPTIN